MEYVDLDELTASIPHWAEDRSLVPVPGLPELATVVLPSSWRATEVMDLAVKGGARFVYHCVERFEASDVELDEETLEQLDAAGRSDAKALRVEAEAKDSEIEEVSVSFVTDGVLHLWSVTAPWAGPLRDRFQELSDPLDETFDDGLPIRHGADAKVVAELLPRVLADPDFRRGAYRERERALVCLDPTLADADGRLTSTGREVLFKAQDEIEAAARSAYQDLDKRLAELAEELAATPAWPTSTTVKLRRIRATDFLTQASGGFPPPGRTVELLLAEPSLQSSRRSGRSTPPPTLPLED